MRREQSGNPNATGWHHQALPAYVIDSSSLRAVWRVLNAMKPHPGDGFRKKNA
jgi:hypothetical protein